VISCGDTAAQDNGLQIAGDMRFPKKPEALFVDEIFHRGSPLYKSTLDRPAEYRQSLSKL
jgi:hypothetical protein